MVIHPAVQKAPKGWTRSSLVVLAVCILEWIFDVYEQTVMQIVTPLLMKEWALSPSTIGNITTIGRWVGMIGIFLFPALADVYGRRPMLIVSILGYSLLSGLTGFSTGWITLLIFGSLNRIALSGEAPVSMLMVSETAPTRWRATALAILVGGFPIGYLLCSLAASWIVPVYGWRALYFLGIAPALLVLWIRFGIQESPRYERVTAKMVAAGLKRQFDLRSPFKAYPREMVIASLVYFLYLFTWIGWSAWMPQLLAVEKKLGFGTAVHYLSIWMFCAIFSYWICGWLSDRYGRRFVIPAFAVPAAALIIVIGTLSDPDQLFWTGLAANFLVLGSFGTGLGYTAELFPTQIRGTAVGAAYTVGVATGSVAPAIIGWIATFSSISAALPMLALSFLLLGPLFLFVAPDTRGHELTDLIGEAR